MEWIAGKDELEDTGFVGEGKWGVYEPPPVVTCRISGLEFFRSSSMENHRHHLHPAFENLLVNNHWKTHSLFPLEIRQRLLLSLFIPPRCLLGPARLSSSRPSISPPHQPSACLRARLFLAEYSTQSLPAPKPRSTHPSSALEPSVGTAQNGQFG